jgi:outer membrane protein
MKELFPLNMKKCVMTAVMTGMMTVVSFSGALAAGLGVVDFQYLEQNHRQFTKAYATYQKDIQQYRNEFTAQSGKMTDQQKQQLVQTYNAKLDQTRVSLFQPIDQDILKQIHTVAAAKNLSNVAVKGYVLDGTAVDITADVAQRIK